MTDLKPGYNIVESEAQPQHYTVVTVGANYETLCHSELLDSMAAALKNVAAQRRCAMVVGQHHHPLEDDDAGGG